MSLAIDESQHEIVDLDTEPDSQLPQRSIVQVTGQLSLSRASEVPLIRPLLPMFLSRTQTESGSDEISDAEAAELMFGAEARHPVVLNIDSSADYALAAILSTDSIVPGNTFDDLEDDLTVFGTIEKVLPEGRAAPLDRYVLPGLNRALRRAIGDLSELLATMPGEPITPSDLLVEGPGALIRPIAIFP